jgi:hypothetical protein
MVLGAIEGMLEQPSLLLGPWQLAGGPPTARVRSIHVPGGDMVGFVREGPLGVPRWLRWLERRELEVYEGQDSSLVFALRHNWGWPSGWHLLDAEERHVGTLRGRAIVDAFGHLLALVEPPGVRGQGRFLAVQGRELGHYTLESDATHIRFEPELEGNPFARMLLLGAVLVLDV